MRISFVLVALLVLSGCAGMEFVAVDYHSGHNYGPYIQPVGHISYTLGYYSDSYYNGYRVYGTHGHRYYHAPRDYRHHRHYSRPAVVHRHVHTSICYARGGHSYVAPRPRYTPPAHVRNDRRTPPRATPPRHTPPQVRNDRRTPPRATPPQQRDKRVKRQDRREDREERNDRRRDHNKKRK